MSRGAGPSRAGSLGGWEVGSVGAGTPGRWPRGPLGLAALAEASGVGIAAALTAAGGGEDSGAAASAAEASGEATATAARRATRHPGLGSAAGRPIAIETEATATATGASAVGMSLVVPGAHLMTDPPAATVTGARGTRARPAATWSPSGPGSPGRMVGIVTETTAGPGTTGRGTTGRRGTRGPGTTTGSGTMTVAAGMTSRGRSAAINHLVLRWVSAYALSGHWWYHSFFLSPSSPRVSKSKSVTGFSFRQLYLLHGKAASLSGHSTTAYVPSVRGPTSISLGRQYTKPRGRLGKVGGRVSA